MSSGQNRLRSIVVDVVGLTGRLDCGHESRELVLSGKEALKRDNSGVGKLLGGHDVQLLSLKRLGQNMGVLKQLIHQQQMEHEVEVANIPN